MSSSGFRELLEAGDVEGLRRAWHKVAPQLPQPASYEQAEIAMHMARTASDSVSLKARVYSHRWLCERMLPSKLPNEMLPAADRTEAKIVSAVGVSVNFSSPWMAPAAQEVQQSVSTAVEECYAAGDTDPTVVAEQMRAAREKTMRALFGK